MMCKVLVVALLGAVLLVGTDAIAGGHGGNTFQAGGKQAAFYGMNYGMKPTLYNDDPNNLPGVDDNTGKGNEEPEPEPDHNTDEDPDTDPEEYDEDEDYHYGNEKWGHWKKHHKDGKGNFGFMDKLFGGGASFEVSFSHSFTPR